jgi:SAM-dependent methyltransferase
MNSSADMNRLTYNGGKGSSELAPHKRHESLQRLYMSLLFETYEDLNTNPAKPPYIIDLGAGDGATTLPILDRGAKITAIDISEEQLRRFRETTASFEGQVDLICGEANSVLDNWTNPCDMVMAISFLHHIPDYLGLVRKAILLLKPGGVLFTFQDPMAYNSVRRFDRLFSAIAYGSWRVFRGDLVGGMERYIRRRRGIYLDECEADNVEYHVVRNGVDQRSIGALLEELGFQTRIIEYHSTQSPYWQRLGEWFNVKNHFAIIAKKPD